MKKTLLIVLATVMVVTAAFAVGYAVGKTAESQPISWVDETGETYISR